MIKVLHNNSCSKSRAILEHLDENNIHFEIIDIIENPLSEIELKTLLKKLNLKVDGIIRTGDDLYKEKFAGKELSEDEWIKVLVENPSLIQRPILIKGSVAMVGRPVENVKFFIDN
ncbi:arsenate reductase family protein [Chryseobacterium sp.]|uniref:arsenate reductase family protein n=1 Tax=Chryseobacterium sp. TaxID=1871047 RepID=UPI0011CBBD8A|nr:ArsC/Spx/MgsR family protein [Chryseobacterium sp.]TXF78898.1 arsenate reductase (glutaredoxin) [Chryseobacterium sp.]